MTRTNEPRNESDESHPTDHRYASFGTEEEFVLYDPENQAAWIASDTTYAPAEMV